MVCFELLLDRLLAPSMRMPTLTFADALTPEDRSRSMWTRQRERVRTVRKGLLTLAFAPLVWVATTATAATLQVDGGGELLGATGVDVGGTLYDVTFVDGTCVALFSGCDDSGDFVFPTSTAAVAASQALLDQVFLDVVSGSFDSVPQATAGCAAPAECYAWTPFSPGSPSFAMALALNRSGSLSDLVLTGGDNPSLDTSNFSPHVFAVWTLTPVPEPSTAILLGLGLGALSMSRRDRRR